MKLQISIEIDTSVEEDAKRLEALIKVFQEVDRDLKVVYTTKENK
jgi:hypothetical protein